MYRSGEGMLPICSTNYTHSAAPITHTNSAGSFCISSQHLLLTFSIKCEPFSFSYLKHFSHPFIVEHKEES